MATNFNIKSMDENGAVIRLLVDDHLVDCRWPKDMPDTDRMPWIKSVANEYLGNIGKPELIDTDASSTPDTDESDKAGFWARVGGWFS